MREGSNSDVTCQLKLNESIYMCIHSAFGTIRIWYTYIGNWYHTLKPIDQANYIIHQMGCTTEAIS